MPKKRKASAALKHPAFTSREVLGVLADLESQLDTILFSEDSKVIFHEMSESANAEGQMHQFAAPRDPSGRFQPGMEQERKPGMGRRIAAGLAGAAAIGGGLYAAKKRGYLQKGGMKAMKGDAQMAGQYVRNKYGQASGYVRGKYKSARDYVGTRGTAWSPGE